MGISVNFLSHPVNNDRKLGFISLNFFSIISSLLLTVFRQMILFEVWFPKFRTWLTTIQIQNEVFSYNNYPEGEFYYNYLMLQSFSFFFLLLMIFVVVSYCIAGNEIVLGDCISFIISNPEYSPFYCLDFL